jgi:arabinofuranan 3-O-arabinosyltransferase
MIEAPGQATPAPASPDHPPDQQPPGRSEPTSTVDERLRHALWLVACCMLLAMLAFVTRPGNILADTKIDMAINPAGFLQRALQLWDPAQFGQLQNQAIGYFFPMGPFFVLGKLLVLPAWVVQRLWITAILVTAFLGTVRLSSRLGIGTPGSRLAAGFAYALAPRALTLVGVNSGEFLPAAMLPLILIPLVRLLRHGHELDSAAKLRAVAQSAAAVALCSGMNAASVVAVLTVAAIYVLTGERSWSRWRVLAWWAPAVGVATLWWTIPLLLLGKYGVSILPYSESAQVTTSVTSLSNMLRGVEDWNSYLVVNGNPWWPVGYYLSTATLPTIATGLVAGLGVTGLLSRRIPERRFLYCALLAGLVIVGSGYVSGLGNPLAAFADHLINGPLAPLRNLRKFDPLIRLPIALGLAQLLASPPLRAGAGQTRARVAQVRARVAPRRLGVAVRVAAVAGLALVALPAYTGGVSQAGDFASVPSYWVSAANWLNAHADNQAVLEVPGARFGEYIWGRPMDDILEPLFDGDWASDQLSAIGSVGNTRLLAAVEQRMDAGEGSAGLTELLARMGVKYILVRNDLIRGDLYGAWPSRIHDALYASPGLLKVAQFGAFPVGTNQPDDAVSNFDSPFPPVEIFQVYGTQPLASVVPAASTIRVYGGPESLLNLADLGALKGRPVLLNDDSPGIAASQYLVTDSLRKIMRNFGEIRIDYTQTLTARDPLSTFEAADDYLEPPWLPYESVAQYHGIANVTASSSAASITALPGQSATGSMPFSAVDGNPKTMWESGGLTGPVHQWLQVDFDHPVDPGTIGVAFADSVFVGPPVTKVTVQTSAGAVTERVRQTSTSQPLAVPRGATGWLRITIDAVAPEPFSLAGSQAGISEISVPGIAATRTIMAPAVRVPGGSPSVLLAKAEPQPSGCMLTSLRWVCSPSLVKPTEEQYGFDEGFTSASDDTQALSGQAIMTSTRLITRYAWPGRDEPHVTASSVYTSDPEDMASAAFDGSVATAWISGATDTHPVLTIRWHGVRTVKAIAVIVPPGATSPAQVVISDRAGRVGGGFISVDGKLTLPRPVRTDQLTLSFTPSQLPVQVSEVVIPGVKSLQANPFAAVHLRCGLGPTLFINGRRVPTRATGTVSDLLNGRPMDFTACSGAKITSGQNTVEEPATDPTGWDVQSILVGPSGRHSLTAAAPVVSTPAPVARWTSSSRQVFVSASHRSYLVVTQNFNTGWQATLGGKVLQPVRLDGWEQGWLLPAGSSGYVTMSYLPDSLYRYALFGGLALLALVIGIALVPLRRRRAVLGPAGAEEAGPVPAGPVPAGPVSAGPVPAGPVSPARRPVRAVTLAITCGWVAVLALAGLWLAGWPGAALLPAAAFLFMTAISRGWRLLGSRWLAAGLLLAAAAGGAAGDLLREHGASGALVTGLWDVGPQLLCLVVVARVAAQLLRPAADDGER